MKKMIIVFALAVAFCVPRRSPAQAQEITQLLLNVEKLRQLEEILDNMYKGYKILTKGYNTVKDIAEGNFNLHKVFLDGLYAVSPVVRDYKRIPYIIEYQKLLARESARAYYAFRHDSNLTAREIRYLENVYAHLLKQSLRNLDELLMIVTASKLRMSDEQRLRSIDRIYEDLLDKVLFVKAFNGGTRMLVMQRAKDRHELGTLQHLYELTP
ncbi:MAG TPA: TerB family tellurite resistance protein [Chryseolinea sp.]